MMVASTVAEPAMALLNPLINTASTAVAAVQEDLFQQESLEGSVQCPDHSLPLNFWSDKEKIYKCIKCLINEKEVHFVDDTYKGHLERFKKI